jgi:hypothetical protein
MPLRENPRDFLDGMPTSGSRYGLLVCLDGILSGQDYIALQRRTPCQRGCEETEVISMKERPSANLVPLEERIRARAFELYVERGNESGSELDDWLQAEEEIAAAEEALGELD